MKKFTKENRGFTLVEILAVIVLISLIVIIAVPSVKSVSAKSKRKLFDTKVKITEEAVNLWGGSNLSCFETGCDVFSDCQDIENNTRKCKTTFGLLAKNNIINYDGEVDGVEYVVNPIDSSNMNDYEIFVFLNNNNNIITSELNKDSIKNPEIIDIISNKNNNNIGNDADKDATSNKVSTSNKKVINITIKYHNNNDDIEYFTNDINATVDLSKIKSKAIKNGYSFYQWSVTYGTASISGDALKVTNDDVIVEAQYKANIPSPESFASDSWATIAANVQANKEVTASTYKVGDTKEVTIDGTDYTVRIANNSNYDCSLESKTACGFVVEFVDIVDKRAMNSDMTNVGGWPGSAMYKYLNGEFLAKLPSYLQSVIADTTVVSGHGPNDSSNFTSTDKLYLLSTKEVWVDGSSNAVSSFDTAYNSTRQLDYYANNNVTTKNYSGAIKNYSGSAAMWWLRAADSYFDYGFLTVYSNGDWNNNNDGTHSGGVAPAFRIE